MKSRQSRGFDLIARSISFGTCLMDAVYPDAGIAAIRMLESQGLEVVFPQGQSCCGQPAFNSGFPEEARAVARRQIEVFSKPYPVVVPSGSCAGMMKHHYPDLFAGRPEEAAAREFSGQSITNGRNIWWKYSP